MYKIQRVSGVIYAESSDGRIRLAYPARQARQVKAIVDMAAEACDEDEPQLIVGAQVAHADAAALGFERLAVSAGLAAKPKKKRHAGAKPLKDENGVPFRLGEFIEQRVNASKTGKISVAEIVDYIKDQYDGELLKARNAIRVAAMKSERFTLANDMILARTKSQAVAAVGKISKAG